MLRLISSFVTLIGKETLFSFLKNKSNSQNWLVPLSPKKHTSYTHVSYTHTYMSSLFTPTLHHLYIQIVHTFINHHITHHASLELTTKPPKSPNTSILVYNAYYTHKYSTSEILQRTNQLDYAPAKSF